MYRPDKFYIVATASLLLVLAGCSSQEPSDRVEQAASYEMPAPTVSVLTLAPEAVTIWDELPGRVSPLRVAEIRPQVSGLILRRLFEEGASVEAGQPLFEIAPDSFKADLASAEAALQKARVGLAQARIERDRSQKLFESNNISQQNFDQIASQFAQAEADVAQAEAAVAKSQIALKFATVTAPIAGDIGAALVSEGSLASAESATSLAVIQQIDSVYIDIRQPSSRLDQLREQAKSGGIQNVEGIPVEILLGETDEGRLSATALFSDISVDEGTGNVRMRVVADNNGRRLLPGMFVRARVPRGQYPEALMVPQQAVIRDFGGNASVYTVDKDNNAVPTPIEVGELVDGRYVVQSGLIAGQVIIVEGQDKLYAPGPVEPSEYSPSAELPAEMPAV